MLKLIQTLNLLKVQVPNNVQVFFKVMIQFVDMKKEFIRTAMRYIKTHIFKIT